MAISMEPVRRTRIQASADEWHQIARRLEKAGPKGPHWFLSGHLRPGSLDRSYDHQMAHVVKEDEAEAIAEAARAMGIKVVGVATAAALGVNEPAPPAGEKTG